MDSDSQASPLSNEPMTPATGVVAADAPPATRRQRVLVFPLKFLLGMVFCQGLLGSVLVVGWTYRLARRMALQLWFRRSGRPQTAEGFVAFLAAGDWRALAEWPNWFWRQDFRGILRSRAEAGMGSQAVAIVRGLFSSLWLNFWTGLSALLCTCALVLPAGILWWFGWYDGWNNSFNKGYEQAAVGPLISVLGIAWFIGVMFYVPLAQARQAVSGHWRGFFDFRFIWRLARANRLACVGLAVLYCALAAPLNILKATPTFWPQMNSALADLPPARALATLNHYYFWCALWMFPAYVALRLVAARIYARAILRGVQAGKILAAELHPFERDALSQLGLLELRPRPQRSRFLRFVAWSTTRVGRCVAATVMVLLLFAFVAQNYISEFICYHGARSWLNQPLVQLPWFHYVPAGLKNPWDDLFVLVLFWLLALLAGSIGKVVWRRDSERAIAGRL